MSLATGVPASAGAAAAIGGAAGALASAMSAIGVVIAAVAATTIFCASALLFVFPSDFLWLREKKLRLPTQGV